MGVPHMFGCGRGARCRNCWRQGWLAAGRRMPRLRRWRANPGARWSAAMATPRRSAFCSELSVMSPCPRETTKPPVPIDQNGSIDFLMTESPAAPTGIAVTSSGLFMPLRYGYLPPRRLVQDVSYVGFEHWAVFARVHWRSHKTRSRRCGSTSLLELEAVLSRRSLSASAWTSVPE